MIRAALAAFAVMLLAAVSTSAKTIVLHDGSQFVVAGSNVNCGVEWDAGTGQVVCFILTDPLGNPPKGSYGFLVSSRRVFAVRYSGGSIRPTYLARRTQPAAVPRDVAARKGSVRENLTLRLNDTARVAGTNLVVAIVKGSTGIGVAVLPLSNAGKTIPGAYGMGLTNKRVTIARFTNAKDASKVVFKRG